MFDDKTVLGLNVLQLAQVIALLFLAITFLQTGLDKFFDFKGNKAYFTDHFKNTPLANSAPKLLVVLMTMELATGLLAAIGAILLFWKETEIGLYACLAANLTLLALFFGQRIGKFYAEAAGIVPYFIVSFISLLLFA